MAGGNSQTGRSTDNGHATRIADVSDPLSKRHCVTQCGGQPQVVNTGHTNFAEYTYPAEWNDQNIFEAEHMAIATTNRVGEFA